LKLLKTRFFWRNVVLKEVATGNQQSFNDARGRWYSFVVISSGRDVNLDGFAAIRQTRKAGATVKLLFVRFNPPDEDAHIRQVRESDVAENQYLYVSGATVLPNINKVYFVSYEPDGRL